MNYFKNKDNKVYAYDDNQVAAGYGEDMIPITEPERDELLAPTEEQKMFEFRLERNQRLIELDRPLWLGTLSAQEMEEIKVYYQLLLDAPQTGVMPERPYFITTF